MYPVRNSLSARGIPLNKYIKKKPKPTNTQKNKNTKTKQNKEEEEQQKKTHHYKNQLPVEQMKT